MNVSWDIPTRIGAILLLRSIDRGHLVEMRMRKETLKILDFKQTELIMFGISVNKQNGQLMYDPNLEPARLKKIEYVLLDGAINMVRQRLQILESQGNVHEDLVAIADFFEIGQNPSEKKEEVNKAVAQKPKKNK